MEKGQVAEKANKNDWPFILWIEPLIHANFRNNALRIKFNKGLHTAALMHDRVVVLPLRSGWNIDAPALVQNNYLTHIGMHSFWNALDNTLKFADVKVMRNYGLKFSQVFQKEKIQADAEARMAKYEIQVSRRADFQAQIQSQQVREFFNSRHRFPIDSHTNGGQRPHATSSRPCPIAATTANPANQCPDSTTGNADGGNVNNNNREGNGHEHNRRRHQHHHFCRKRLFKDFN